LKPKELLSFPFFPSGGGEGAIGSQAREVGTARILQVM